MLKGFKNFLMQGDLIVIAVGLVVALAFSTLIKAFTDSIIAPLVNAIGESPLRPVSAGSSTVRRSTSARSSWPSSISSWWSPTRPT
jgi:large-conductance mechanosensitive channel